VFRRESEPPSRVPVAKSQPGAAGVDENTVHKQPALASGQRLTLGEKPIDPGMRKCGVFAGARGSRQRSSKR
jgi:hypothetical protein